MHVHPTSKKKEMIASLQVIRKVRVRQRLNKLRKSKAEKMVKFQRCTLRRNFCLFHHFIRIGLKKPFLQHVTNICGSKETKDENIILKI